MANKTLEDGMVDPNPGRVDNVYKWVSENKRNPPTSGRYQVLKEADQPQYQK